MRRPGDSTPDPPGGRAAERLRMFEDARRPPRTSPATSVGKQASQGPKKRTKTGSKGSVRHEEQGRRKK